MIIEIKSPLQEALEEKDEEKEDREEMMEMKKISLLERILMKLDEIAKPSMSKTNHIGGGGC